MSMDTGRIPFLIATILILYFINGAIVIAESAAARFKERRLEEHIRAGMSRAEAALRAGKELGAHIETARLSTTIVGLIFGWLAGPYTYSLLLAALTPVLPGRLAVVGSALSGLLILAMVHLLFAHLLPQRIGARGKLAQASFFRRLSLIVHRISSPLISLVHSLANGFSKLFGVDSQPVESDLSPSELSLIALRSRSQGAHGATQREILTNYFAYQERTVGELMIPRQDVAAIPSTMRLREARDAVRQFGFTRYPVYDGDEEHMIGVVHFRELVDASDATPRAPVSDVMHVAVTLSPRTLASEALQKMQERGSHLAIVAAEHGASVGIVTIEDLLREFLFDGPSHTDSAVPPPRSVEVAPGVFEFDSSLVVQEVEDLLDVDLHHAGFETIGGYVFGRLGRKPKVGDSVKADGVIFDVIDVRGARIRRLRGQRSREAPPPKPKATP